MRITRQSAARAVTTGRTPVILAAIAALLIVPSAPPPATATSATRADRIRALAEGVVTDDGTPVAGADVLVRLWPNDRTLSRLEKGDTVPLRLLETTSTSAQGAYSLRVSPREIPGRYLNPGGLADVEVIVATATREMRWNYTVRAHPARDDWSLAAGRAAEVATRLDFGSRTAFELSNDPASWLTQTGAPASLAGPHDVASAAVMPRTREVDHILRVRTGVVAMDDNCSWKPGNKHLGLPEMFLHVQAWDGAKGKVIQTTWNEHTLGIGVSSAGDWSQGGTATKSFGASASQSGIINKDVWNKVNYQDYSNDCVWGIQRRPLGYYDLISNLTNTIVVGYPYCSVKYPGYDFSTTTAENVTYSQGVDIGPIKVSSQAGYGHGVTLAFPSFTKKSRMCWNNQEGPLASSRIETRAP